MTITEWKEAIAVARTLEGGELLAGMSDEEILAVCNGVGAKWADAVHVCGVSLSDVANRALPWAVPASIIHDVRYDIGGDRAAKDKADAEFLRNLRAGLPAWYDPRRYIRLLAIRQMGRLLALGGWLAFRWTDSVSALAEIR